MVPTYGKQTPVFSSTDNCPTTDALYGQSLLVTYSVNVLDVIRPGTPGDVSRLLIGTVGTLSSLGVLFLVFFVVPPTPPFLLSANSLSSVATFSLSRAYSSSLTPVPSILGGAVLVIFLVVLLTKGVELTKEVELR